MTVLLVILISFTAAACLVGLLSALGYSLPLDGGKLAEARAYRAHKRELNASVEARRVK